MFLSPQNIAIYVAGALIIVLIIIIIRLEKRLNNILGGTHATSIEEGMKVLREELKAMQTFSERASAHFQNIEKRLRNSIQHVETVRFNPFKGTGAGGNQSFSTSFTNEHGDGVVISTLHSRERISVFSKPLKGFSSEFELSDEEKEVVGRAKQDTRHK